MNRQVMFFGYPFTVMTFLLLAFAWTICLFGVLPYFLHSHGLVYLFYTVAALIFAGVVNRYLIVLILIAFCIHKSIVVWYQNFMLVFSGFLATFIYRLFVYQSFWMTILHFFIITFSVLVYYTLVIKVVRINGED